MNRRTYQSTRRWTYTKKGIEIYKELVVLLNEAKVQVHDVYAQAQQLMEGVD